MRPLLYVCCIETTLNALPWIAKIWFMPKSFLQLTVILEAFERPLYPVLTKNCFLSWFFPDTISILFILLVDTIFLPTYHSWRQIKEKNKCYCSFIVGKEILHLCIVRSHLFQHNFKYIIHFRNLTCYADGYGKY